MQTNFFLHIPGRSFYCLHLLWSSSARISPSYAVPYSNFLSSFACLTFFKPFCYTLKYYASNINGCPLFRFVVFSSLLSSSYLLSGHNLWRSIITSILGVVCRWVHWGNEPSSKKSSSVPSCFAFHFPFSSLHLLSIRKKAGVLGGIHTYCVHNFRSYCPSFVFCNIFSQG